MQQPRSPILITSLVAGAFFMENLDGTIIATALPQMAASFHVGAVNLNVGMTAYLLTLAVFIPISGWVADRFGARSVFAFAIAVFTLASLFCSLCHTLTQFVLMRILQGVGGAMMVPVGRLIVLHSTPKDRLTQAIAYMSWPGLSALVLGPPVGGLITTYASWHWIFLMNLPVGAAAFVLTLLWIENRRSDEQRAFDWSSFALGCAASIGLLYSVEKLAADDAGRILPALILAGSLVCGVLAVLAARRHRDTSFIDLESMRSKSYSLSVFGASAFRISVSVLPFLLPLMFQIAFGLSAFHSGLFLLALFGGDLTMKALVIPVLRRFGFRSVLIVNGLLTALSLLVCATLAPSTPPVVIAAILFVHGAFRSMQFTCFTTLAYTEITPERMSRANGFLSTIMQLSMGMGIAVGAITLRMASRVHGHTGAAPHLADFHLAIALVAILSFISVLDSLGLAAEAGAATSGHRPAQLEFSPAE